MEQIRLIAVGDLHGSTEALFSLLDGENPDGLLCVGDWGDPGQVTEATWRELLARVPVLTVYGNHDDLPLLSGLRNSDDTPVLLRQGERRRFCEFAVAGVSGIWAKSHRMPHYVTDEDVAGWAARLADTLPTDGMIDVLLTHGCPLGIADRTPSGHHGGQQCFLNLLNAVAPSVYLCGHLHVAQEKAMKTPTCHVINTGAFPLRNHPYVVIERQDTGSISAHLRLFQTN